MRAIAVAIACSVLCNVYLSMSGTTVQKRLNRPRYRLRADSRGTITRCVRMDAIWRKRLKRSGPGGDAGYRYTTLHQLVIASWR